MLTLKGKFNRADSNLNFNRLCGCPAGMQTLLSVIMGSLPPSKGIRFIGLSDGDQLAADFYVADIPTDQPRKLLIATQGPHQPYVLSMCYAASKAGFDVLTSNLLVIGGWISGIYIASLSIDTPHPIKSFTELCLHNFR